MTKEALNNIHSLQTMRESKEMSASIEARCLDAASLWITKLDQKLSAKEQESLSTWLADSPRNVEVFIEVARMWDKMHTLNRLADLFPKNASFYQAVDVSKRWKGAMVASVAMILSLSIFIFSNTLKQNDPAELLAKSNVETTLMTNVGGSETVYLPDGSKIVLNTNTLAKVQFTDNARIIELERGEFHIDVAHDKSRPLSIIVAGKIIQAVGTAFNVEVQNGSIELIVTDGKVLVADISNQTEQLGLSGSDTNNLDTGELDFNKLDFSKLDISKLNLTLPQTSIAISKGEKINLAPVGLPNLDNFKEEVISIEPTDIAASLSWRTGNLIFRGESLADAMAEISRYSDITIELDDDLDLKMIKVAGMFRTGDISGLLYVLEQNFNINSQQIDEHKIFLKLASKS